MMSPNSHVEPNVVFKAFARINSRFHRWLAKNPPEKPLAEVQSAPCPLDAGLPAQADALPGRLPE